MIKPHIKALFWDIGGVLVRTGDRSPRTALAQHLGTTYHDLEELVFNSPQGRAGQIGRIRAEDHWRWVAAQFGLPASQAKQLEADFFAGDALDRDLLAWIAGLHGPYRTGVISNAFNAMRTFLDGLGVTPAFDTLVISAEVGIAKPDLSIYRIALDRLGMRPQESIFVDDFAHNIAAAQAFGMHAIQFKSAEQVRQEIEAILQA